MTLEARSYQLSAIRQVRSHFSAGCRSLVLVAPTGSGKTFMGARIARDHGRVLWVANRRELVSQAAERLRGEFPDVGIVCAGMSTNERAPVVVTSVQTMLERGFSMDCTLVVVDECHHYVADVYRTIFDAHRGCRLLGLTATPERKDGRALGDVFEQLVVAAQYSELIAAGDLVDAVVLRPTEYLRGALVSEPVDAYLQHLAGHRAIAFLRSVAESNEFAAKLSQRGVRARHVDALTPHGERDLSVELLRSGAVSVLSNVDVFTEGFDCPEATAVVCGRAYQFAGTMLQAFGRALRPSPGKARAVILDLAGITHIHGLPTEDRSYSLEGKPMAVAGEVVERAAPSAVERKPLQIVGGALEAVATSEGHDLDGFQVRLAVPRKQALVDIKRLAVFRGKNKARRAADFLDFMDRIDF